VRYEVFGRLPPSVSRKTVPGYYFPNAIEQQEFGLSR